MADRPPVTVLLALLGLALTGGVGPVFGQCGPQSSAGESGAEVGTPPSDAPHADPGDGDERAWWNVWSERSTEDRVLWGMWSTHVNRESDGWQNDRALALIYCGFFGATFRTTHGPQAYSLGVERSWARGSAGPLLGMVGFRGGLMYGYDGRLGWVAEKYPVLPFAQPVLYGRLGPLTTDLTYTWVVISLTAGLRF